MREIEALRTECSKTYGLGNGERKLVCYGRPIHYLDHVGLWQDIDVRLGGTFYSGNADGFVQNYGVNWNTTRGAATGTYANDVSPANSRAISVEYSAIPSFFISRSFFYFDTSAIPDAAPIVSAVLSLWGDSHAESSVCAMRGTQADPLTTADFDSFSGVSYGYTLWNVGQYNSITFNEAGRNDINKTGITKICAREYYRDYFGYVPVTLYRNGARFAENFIPSQRPKLEVTYSISHTINTTESMPIAPDTVVFDLDLNIFESLSFSDMHGIDVVQAIQDVLGDIINEEVVSFLDDVVFNAEQVIPDTLEETDVPSISIEEWSVADTLVESDQPAIVIEQPVPDTQVESDGVTFNVGEVVADTLLLDTASELWQDTEGVTFQDGEVVWVGQSQVGVVFDVGKPVAESFPFQDTVPFGVAPSQIYDAHTISDIPSFGLGQPVPEAFTISDEPVAQAAPWISDSLPLSDSYRVAMGMALRDALTESDNVGDILIGEGVAQLWEQLSFWDRVRFVVTNVYQEVLSLVGAVAKWVTKPVVESFPMTESFPGSVSKGIWDYLYLFDAVAFNIETAMQDSLGWLDEVLFLPGANFAEILTLSDNVLYSELLELLDVLQIVDSYDRICDTYRDYTEVLPITDRVVYDAATTILDLLNFSDTPLLLVGKVISDVLPISDVVGPLPILQSILDVLALSDVVELNRYLPGEIPQVQWVLSRLANLKPGSSWVRSVDPYELYVAVGESDITGTVFDTVLWDEVHRKKGVIRVVANTVFVRAVFGQDEPTADDLSIKEIAIFDAAAGGTLIERWVLGSPVAKDNVDEIVVECAVTIVHGEIEALTTGHADSLAMADTVSMVLTPGP